MTENDFLQEEKIVVVKSMQKRRRFEQAEQSNTPLGSEIFLTIFTVYGLKWALCEEAKANEEIMRRRFKQAVKYRSHNESVYCFELTDSQNKGY